MLGAHVRTALALLAVSQKPAFLSPIFAEADAVMELNNNLAIELRREVPVVGELQIIGEKQ